MPLADAHEPTAKLLRELLNDARDGLLALDEHGMIIDANEAAAHALGRLRRHVVGKPLAVFVPLEERRQLRSTLVSLSGLDRVQLELPLAGADRPTMLVFRAVPYVVPKRIAVTLLTSGGSALPPRAESTFELERFLLRFPHAVVGLRRDLRVAFSNQRARRLLGGENLRVGRPLSEPAVGKELRALAHRLVRRPAPLSATSVELPDGRILRIAGIAAQEDEPAVLLIEDVTEQHRRDRVMREFVRNAAHQLRTPLTGITTAVQVLQSGAKDVPEDRDRFLAHVEQHTARLNRITHGLLALARAQSGEQVLRLDAVELGSLLESLAAEADPTPGVRFETTYPGSIAALAEPDLVREALAALVDNAVAHTRGGIVRLAAREEDGRVAIEVTDTGAGILPEHRTRVFEPFYRGGETGDGFGLGLAIAAQAVAAMDGELRLEDAPGGGTQFTMILPSAQVAR